MDGSPRPLFLNYLCILIIYYGNFQNLQMNKKLKLIYDKRSSIKSLILKISSTTLQNPKKLHRPSQTNSSHLYNQTMGFLMYIIFALIFGAAGFALSEFLHKKKAAGGAGAGPDAGPGPSPAKGAKGGKGGKSAKTRSAETAASVGSKKAKKK
ncbi:hypothetical protein ACQ4LE_003287 [Meloidogyne hapla]